MLFLMAAGLTLIFGIMNLINLAHGSLYMIGAYVAAAIFSATGSFLLGLAAALSAAVLVGIAIEIIVFRTLYERDHLDQVLATFGLILFFNEMVRILWGSTALYMSAPGFLSGRVELLPGIPYPAYRVAIIAVGLAIALLLYLLIARTRIGMLIRAGACVDADLYPDGGGIVRAAARLVSAQGSLRWAADERQTCRDLCRARRAGAGSGGRDSGRSAFLHRAVRSHHGVRDRRGQSRPDPRLWRARQLWSRRLSRHRRLCRGHPELLRHNRRRRAFRDGVFCRCDSGAGHRFRVAAHFRCLFHHDHLGVRPDGVFRRYRPQRVWRRRWAQHRAA